MKFSVIICTYNREKYISKSAVSVCGQVFSSNKFELLIIDNNSPDNTAEICRELIRKYPEVDIRYFLEANQGISYARNRGIAEAKGDFIVFIDDDETVDNNYLSKLDTFLVENPQVQLCGVPVFPVYETEKPEWLSRYTSRLLTGYYYHGKSVRKLDGSDYPGTGHAIIKKELFEKYGNFNTELGRKANSLLGAEDKDMFLRLIRNNIDCYYFPDIAIYHHIPASKLTCDYFNRLTYSIGVSERIRTKSLSSARYYRKRLLDECFKWAATCLLGILYTLCFSPSKALKLFQFRWNVSKGLLGF